MMFALLSVVGLFQDPIPAVRADEARRVEVVARCAPAVCSVMAMDAPGGGSGVVIDPRGYVLTNFHVVGSPDEGYRPPEPVLPAAELEAWRHENLPRGSAHYRNKKVGMPDGELYEAVVLGIDPGSDL
ncbi:MAG: trypsin-like peptidase domain-containing protein, partial [Planctomycetota bacterium]